MHLLTAGQPTELTSLVTRLLAPNPGMMTGPGTNTYLVGRRQVAVIDPGPLNESHVDAIIAATSGEIRWVFVTHTHFDHSPAAKLLVQKTGAELIAFEQPAHGPQDPHCLPTLAIKNGHCFETDEFVLTALHTPGHASNHLCYLLEPDGLLFSGDHIMQGSTVVIAPTDGNMTDYLQSLKILQQDTIKTIAPGHGHLILEASAEIERLIKHRFMRENKVVQVLQSFEQAKLSELLPLVYDDVPVFLHPVAHCSLHAHLIRLVELGRVVRLQDHWSLL